MIVPLYIPVVNRFDLARKAYDSVRCHRIQIRVIDNSNTMRDCEFFSIYRPPVPLNFSQTQNWMLKLSSIYPFYLFMHSDAEAGEGTVAKLVEMAENQTEKWGAIFTNYDSLAAFNTEAMTTIGGWDQNLIWYAGDNDCYRRLRLAGYPTLESNLPVKHKPSQTLKADPEVKRAVDFMIPFRTMYYRAKWGGDPGREIFAVPFGGK